LLGGKKIALKREENSRKKIAAKNLLEIAGEGQSATAGHKGIWGVAIFP